MAGRIVAELGRPETAEETAARKAESSRAYRSSKTARNLAAALLVTLAVVAVIVFAVPRGEPAAREPIDVVAVAAQVSSSLDRTVIVPALEEDWTVNSAAVESSTPSVWTIVYVPGEDAGFVRVAQGFDADVAWPTRVLSGADTDGALTVDGIEWTRYVIDDPAGAGNVSAALSTAAGDDIVMVYGSSDAETVALVAAALADQVRALQEEAE